jgi:hypothetical protein
MPIFVALQQNINQILLIFEMKTKTLIGIILLFCINSGVSGQYYNQGTDPASVKWKQINTAHFRLIYPPAFEKNAQYSANLLESSYIKASASLSCFPRKLPVIFHTQDVTANAFSVVAPRRMEYYTCPPQNTYAQNWLEQLAIHEFRHTVQADKLNQGFTKLLSYIFGEQGPGAILGIFVPLWFMEGDAVCTETALSHSGRGRIPGFEMELRAQLLEKGKFSYDKAVYGSYRDYVTDHYTLGYQLSAYAREKFGKNVWSNVLTNVAKYPFTITPFNIGLRKITGMTKVGLYNRTLENSDSLWRIQAKQSIFTNYKTFPTRPNSSYARYKYPHYLNDSVVLAERTTFDDISRLITIQRNGREKVMFTPGLYSSEVISVATNPEKHDAILLNKPGAFTADNISTNRGLVVWTEKSNDIRWLNRSYSVIKILDLSTGHSRQLTHQSRLFAPCISHDGKQIVAVKMGEDNRSSLVLLNSTTGEETDCLASSEYDLFLNPGWSEDGKRVVYMILSQKGKSIKIMNIADKKSRMLAAPVYVEIANPMIFGRWVFFNGSFSGIENIYALDTASLKVSQVTSSAYGSFNASVSPDSKHFVYSNYTSKGYEIAEAELKPENWIPLNQVSNNLKGPFQALADQEHGLVDSLNSGHIVYNSRKYSKAGHLFNFHSWAPAYLNINTPEFKPGISFMSQNALSTATTILGYAYDLNEQTGNFHADFIYEGWYPVFDFKVTSGQHASTNHKGERFTWNENIVDLAIRLPLHFNYGKYFCGVQPEIDPNFIEYNHNASTDTGFISGTIKSLGYRLFAYNYIKSNAKDMAPQWGQSIDMNFRHTPIGDNNLGNISSVETVLYFPGIIRHHSIRMYCGWQHREVSNSYVYSNLISFPRGYYNSPIYFEEVGSFGINYKLPLLYPDLSLGSFAFIKRVKTNLFYDYASGSFHETLSSNPLRTFLRKDIMRSYGAEFTSDIHILRLLVPADIGARFAYRPNNNSMTIEFIFSINLNIL